jgi:Zn-dependent protease with chaperone function
MSHTGSMTARWSLTSVVVALAVVVGAAQTPVTPPENSYTPAQDVELGREAAAEARKQLPIMNDREVTALLDRVGHDLVSALADELRHPDFEYTFEAVNVRDVNAFALPGGPMFINRGLIQTSKTEGELASVMAHELSHVALRHGTAQASKAPKYQLGQVAGAIVGAIIGGRVGSVVSQTTQFGLGTAFLRFGREYERQADLLGAQIMARAGYDPREMAAMFRTLESRSGGGPEWMSSHPNPGNRAEAILKEAESLTVSDPVTQTAAFNRLKSHLGELPRAPTTAEAIKNAPQRTSSPRTTGARTATRVEAPSTRYTEYSEGDIFSVSVPSNWREMASATSVTFAPEGGYDDADGQGSFTHGVQFGVVRNGADNLRTATEELIESIGQGNPGLGRPSSWRNVTIDGRRGLQTVVVNAVDGTNQRETLRIVTAPLPDGNVLYMIAVAPEAEVRSYQTAFDRVVRSITLHD